MLLDGIARLDDSTAHLPHGGLSGPWTASLELASIASNGLVAPRRFPISASLFVLRKERRDVVETPGILLGFAGFIGACGLTHLCEATTRWWPALGSSALIDAITAVMAMGTATILPWGIRVMLRIPTPAEYRRAHDELKRACNLKDRTIGGVRETIRALRHQMDRLEQMRRTEHQVADREATLRELYAILPSSYPREGPS